MQRIHENWMILNHIKSYYHIFFNFKVYQVAKKVLPCRCFISCSRAWIKGLSDSAVHSRRRGASWTMPSDSASKADVAWQLSWTRSERMTHRIWIWDDFWTVRLLDGSALVSEGSSVCKHKSMKWQGLRRMIHQDGQERRSHPTEKSQNKC